MVTRKCGICGQSIEIDRTNSNGALLYKGKYYHDPCFAQFCADKVSNSRTQKAWAGVYEGVEQYRENARKMGAEACVKDDIFKWMCEKYPVSQVSPRTFQKLNDIYDGKIAGMCYKIAPQELFDEWQYYMEEMQGFRQGKSMDGDTAIRYDLSILVRKNAEYKAIQENEKIALVAQQQADQLRQQQLDENEIQFIARENKQRNNMAQLYNEMINTKKG